MNQLKKSTRFFLLFVTIHVLFVSTTWGQAASITPPPVSGRAASPEATLPADVLARVQWFHEELEAIRLEMGKPKDRRVTRLATDALPHEVYFQAITLFIKADRLALELTGSTGLRPQPVSPSAVRPYHTWVLVTAALDRLLTIKTELGIQETLPEKVQPASTKPTEVARAIVQANRQLNVMLQRRFSSSDVFQQVSWGIQYAKALLAQFPAATPSATSPPFERGKQPGEVFLQQVSWGIQYAKALLAQFPAATPSAASPPFERGKQPGEVFLRLVQCFKQVEDIARLSGTAVLHLDVKAAKHAMNDFDIQPSDVYDLATLLVSDLTYLYGRLKDVPSIPSVPFPGRKFPSHTYQQAGILLDHLRALEQQVRANPN